MLLQEKLLEQVIARYRQNSNVRAIFVAGSFARGDQHALSDIDLVLIVKKPRHYVRYFHDGVHIEVDSLTLAEIPRRVRADPTTYYSLAKLKKLFDPSRLARQVATLVTRSNEKYRVTDLAKADLYFQLVHYRLKLLAAQKNSDFVKVGMLIPPAQEKCLQALAAINAVPPLPPLQILHEFGSLKKVPPALAKLLHELATGGTSKRMRAVLRTMDFLIPRLEPSLRKFPTYYKPWPYQQG